ncbi:hypothetical protein llap_8663 [Limosa lapponica baueri]|uniref:Uncharacterized protein n=1 Tax=Limosa lapponica baueri TaxID=1758121 RepID=A0A2I0U4P0_LIMLA|nr:hypothetical protein llap_8663 [Limosa lapponica baueri]
MLLPKALGRLAGLGSSWDSEELGTLVGTGETTVDGGLDDPAIKTLVEELRDLDSVGQIFCLALGRLL